MPAQAADSQWSCRILKARKAPMSQHTKKILTECALRLAEKKPINKITVREIVTECDMTRNTFYYHFHDIYDVFKCYLDDRTEELLKQADQNAESGMFAFMELCAEHKRVFLNLYKSVGHEAFSKFAMAKLEQFLTLSIEKQYDTTKISPLDLEIICVFYEEAMLGILLRWLHDRNFDDPDDMMDYLERIRVLFEGQLEQLIKKCSSKEN